MDDEPRGARWVPRSRSHGPWFAATARTSSSSLSEFDFLPLVSPTIETGLTAGACHRWTVIALDEEGQISDAISATVRILDTTAPRITSRIPVRYATGFARNASIKMTFSEPVQGGLVGHAPAQERPNRSLGPVIGQLLRRQAHGDDRSGSHAAYLRALYGPRAGRNHGHEREQAFSNVLVVQYEASSPRRS